MPTSNPLPPAQIDELREVAERVARRAGDLVRDGRPDRVEVAATKTSPQDVVTAMDLASEKLLRELLAVERPGDGVLGEEGGFTQGSTGITWVVDPIDGTVNYLYGLANYSVMVAAVVTPDGGEPDPATWTVLAGCVHAPGDGRTFTAGLGAGAWFGDRRLRIDEPGPLDLCLVGTGFGYRRQARELQGAVLAELLPQVRDIRRLGSAGLDLCTLASGGLDLFFERGLRPWDLAAPSLVVTEAGGVITGLRGRPAGEVMTVAGHRARVGELQGILERTGADAPLEG
ncbi:inositol monophosphatase family protein [Cellulomonas citrea]|uniref:inositol monophosphatase family protein n=1 Tax=Cellulomonas citrea TaxID=1909423 RepID=UPI00135B0E7E|nr:inositol monophosphatase family protein [Cellulomonas citrea]